MIASWPRVRGPSRARRRSVLGRGRARRPDLLCAKGLHPRARRSHGGETHPAQWQVVPGHRAVRATRAVRAIGARSDGGDRPARVPRVRRSPANTHQRRAASFRTAVI